MITSFWVFDTYKIISVSFMCAVKPNNIINTFEFSFQVKDKNIILHSHLPVCSSSSHSTVSLSIWKHFKNSNSIIRLLTKNSNPWPLLTTNSYFSEAHNSNSFKISLWVLFRHYFFRHFFRHDLLTFNYIWWRFGFTLTTCSVAYCL